MRKFISCKLLDVLNNVLEQLTMDGWYCCQKKACVTESVLCEIIIYSLCVSHPHAIHPMQCIHALLVYIKINPNPRNPQSFLPFKNEHDQQVHPLPLGASSVWTLVNCRRPCIKASLASSISSLCSTNFLEIARNTSSTPVY